MFVEAELEIGDATVDAAADEELGKTPQLYVDVTTRAAKQWGFVGAETIVNEWMLLHVTAIYGVINVRCYV